ncbi:Acetylornithine and succinylornithine aminotransferase [Prochlorococcus marinus str. MIT 9515]|uniref:Acetylornithine aminotransferase n=2 Tax=Prochlorococcus marinus TaxID=1219 RepID=A2BY08_PROM5|nr:Acetylornithine and succinylornithine aminotransferase [Prochlorococcus marinus str. MIT 9515]
MELVDAPHSKCGTFGFVGSSPTAPTLMNTYTRFNISFKKGEGCWLWDTRGKKYLDAVAGIATCSLGHSDRILRKKLVAQLKKLQHISNLYKIEEQEELSKYLTKQSCAESVFFCNSGAEANESAIKLIKKFGNKIYTGKETFILAAESSFHGRTLATLSATGQPKYQKGFEPMVKGFKFFKYNDIASVKKLFDECQKNDQKVSGVLIEPIQGEGGVIPGDKLFFKDLRKLCTQNNSLLILDEVQSGVGRTGKMWGYETLGIEPDGFTLAKGLGGGHAIGALLVKEKANIFSPGDHASTFGGNPFACRAALTVLEEITRRKILNNVISRGNQLNEGFIKLSDKFPNIINGIRGIGLIQGLVINNSYTDPKTITLKAFDKGLLLVPAGGNVVRFVPPLIISRNEIKILLKKLNLIFEEL